MPRYKPNERNGLFLSVMLDEQIQPGTFEFALDHLVDHELGLSGLDAKFNNDEVGASAYDPRVMLKIVLLAYSRGLISSRKIGQACEQNVVFIALSGDARPSYSHIAKFVRELGDEVRVLFAQVLMTCDRAGLIGKTMFAIDGVKLPANASKERSGTHAELAHRADRRDKAAAKIVALHQAQDEHGTENSDTQRQHRVQELQREAQVTREFIASRAKQVNRKGQELKSKLTDPNSAKMATSKPSNTIVRHVRQNEFMRQRSATRGRQVARFEAKQADPNDPSERMRRAIDSAQGRRLYSQRMGTVEPVFANIRHHKRMSRFTLRGVAKVRTQWNLYCLVHNIVLLGA